MAANFPINSTSVITASIERVGKVLQRAGVSDVIAYGGVYNCRFVVGTTTPSQHSYGNAIDLFPEWASGGASGALMQAELRRIAEAVVRHATKKTVANRGVRLDVAQVIDHDAGRIWTPADGWHVYTGTTGAHIHVSGNPMYSGPCGSRP